MVQHQRTPPPPTKFGPRSAQTKSPAQGFSLAAQGKSQAQGSGLAAFGGRAATPPPPTKFSPQPAQAKPAAFSRARVAPPPTKFAPQPAQAKSPAQGFSLAAGQPRAFYNTVGRPGGIVQGWFRSAVLQMKGNSFALPGDFRLPSDPGKPLPEAVRSKMENFYNSDFSGVRVHVGPEAPAIGALAFTVGDTIVFAPGQYDPVSTRGQQILGHELAHVVQQRAGRVHNPYGSNLAVVQDNALEAEADRLGQRAATGMTSFRSAMSTKNRETISCNKIQMVKKRPRSEEEDRYFSSRISRTQRIHTQLPPNFTPYQQYNDSCWAWCISHLLKNKKITIDEECIYSLYRSAIDNTQAENTVNTLNTLLYQMNSKFVLKITSGRNQIINLIKTKPETCPCAGAISSHYVLINYYDSKDEIFCYEDPWPWCIDNIVNMDNIYYRYYIYYRYNIDNIDHFLRNNSIIYYNRIMYFDKLNDLDHIIYACE